MINEETILSNYNDRLTLLQWLKKVELALKNASAKEFRVNKLGNATLTFSIVFDDDTELTTGPIVLQQGESVASAEISGGHLLLTLTNGDVLDAGEILNGDLNVTGSVTATGDITAGGKLIGVTEFEKITDADGHLRFAEGDIDLDASIPAGVTKLYGKWSLSGSHLMFVFVLSFEDGTALTTGSIYARATLPAWIHDKIAVLWSTNSVDRKSFTAFGDDWSTQSVGAYISKISANRVAFVCTTTQTISGDRNARFEFDLLID